MVVLFCFDCKFRVKTSLNGHCSDTNPSFLIGKWYTRSISGSGVLV